MYQHRIDWVRQFLQEAFEKSPMAPKLFYHNFEHTKEVVSTVNFLAKASDLPESEIELLEVAAWFHDVGYLEQYANHEKIGIEISKQKMPVWGFSSIEVDWVCNCIEATQLHFEPRNLAEAILSDADIAYGVTHHFFERGPLLRKEWELYLSKTYLDLEWELLQEAFLPTVKLYSKEGKIAFQNIIDKNIQQQVLLVQSIKNNS